jgi:phosphoglucosamine mutase
VVVDERGNVIEGDRLLGLLAHYMRANERLHSNTLVTTVMSNIGLLRAMEQAGINVAVTTVGDRYVLDHMNQHGFTLGGEQSGHVIIRDRATTGDGLMAAIAVLELMVDSGRPISQLADEVMITVPQVLINVKTNVPAGEAVSRMQDEIDAAVRELGTRGRVLVRASGTEPLVRVMVECDSAQEAQRVAEGLAARATSL